MLDQLVTFWSSFRLGRGEHGKTMATLVRKGDAVSGVFVVVAVGFTCNGCLTLPQTRQLDHALRNLAGD